MKLTRIFACALLLFSFGCGHSKPKGESTSFKNDLRDSDSPYWNKKK